MSNILIVEDDQFLRDAYSMILSTQPYNISSAEDGVQALRLCEANQYDVILLDLMMPGLDGLGFLKVFSTHNAFSKTKIIVFSNLSSGDELERVKAFNVFKTVVKAELAPRELIDLVQNALQS